MFNLPYIVYGVFVIFFVANIVIGYKRGFKLALYVFLLTIISIAISIGIAFAFYPLLREPIANMLKKHFDGNDAYNFKSLVDATRPQAFAMLISIAMVVIFPLLWLLTFAVRKIFVKYDFPILEKLISPNHKTVRAGNVKLNKAMGLAGTTLTSVLTASVVASALSPIMIKPNKFSFFNSTVGAFSKAMTFGFGYSNSELNDIYKFIPMTKDSGLMTGFNKFLIPGLQLISQQEIDAFNNSVNHDEFLKLLLNTDAGAILSVIVSNTGTTGAWKPLGNEYDLTPYPMSDIDTNSNGSKSVVEQTLDKLNIKISGDDASQITSWIRNNGVQKFEDTQAYKNWRDRNAMIANVKEEIKNAYTELGNRRQAANDAYREQESLFARQDKILKVEWGAKNIQHDNLNASLKKADADEKSAKTELDSKTAEFIQKNDAYNTHHTTTFNTASARVTSAKATYDLQVGSVNNLESQVQSAKNGIANENKTLSALQAEATRLNGQIPALQNEVSIKNTAKSAAAATQNTKQSDFNNAQSATTSAQNALNGADKTDAALITKLTNELASARAKESTALNALNAANSALANATIALDNANTNLANVQSRITSNTSSQSSASSALARYQSDLTKNTSDLASANQTKDNAKLTFDSLTAALVPIKSEDDRLKGISDAAQRAKDGAENAHNQMTTELNRLKGESASLKAQAQALSDEYTVTWNKIKATTQKIKELVQDEYKSNVPQLALASSMSFSWEGYSLGTAGDPNAYTETLSKNSQGTKTETITNGTYSNSIKFQQNPSGDKNKLNPKTTDLPKVTPAVSYEEWDVTKIGVGTPGKIEFLEHQLTQLNLTVNALVGIRDNKHREFDERINKYIEMYTRVLTT